MLGIEDLHLHNLRHTAATDMLASGMGIEYVQEVLGHADISTTQIYTKILQKNLRREMQKIRPTTQLKLVVFLRYLDIGHGVS
jgi:site-specific recombinase XerD